MAKKALLVGCNYPGTEAALNGCINDVWGMKDVLIEFYGFDEGDIEVMIDTDEGYTQPTGKNIKNSLKTLVSGAEDGDILVFHFSGHGTQVPSQDDDEGDRLDEALVPTDMNLITDDDLRNILRPLPDGAKFTLVCDCCHSGSMLDHQAVAISGDKTEDPAEGFGGEQASRSLDPSMLVSILGKATGNTEMGGVGSVYKILQATFGEDSSVKINVYSMLVAQAYTAVTGSQLPINQSVIQKIMGMCLGHSSTADATGGEEGGEPTFDAATHIPEAISQPLGEDKGILITGCQDDETSADACPDGDPQNAHGALSNALHKTIREHFENNPDEPLTYMQLVGTSRRKLAETGFAQNPCLECSEKNANSTFILHD